MISLPALTRAGRRGLLAPSRVLASLVTASVLVASASAATEQWQAIPLSPDGGEGCQVIQAIAVAPSNSSLLFMGIDVGGLYRSTDGAANWVPVNNNLSPRGASDIAVDPRNANRVLVAGANSSTSTNAWNGLWLSTNKGDSWTEVQAYTRSGYRDFRRSIAYNPASYDSTLGYCTVVYWSSDGALYKSTNGGSSWSSVNTSLGKSSLRMHPGGAYLYAANSTGFYRSTDGASFTLLQSGDFRSVEVLEGATTTADRNKVWAGTTSRTFYYSTDSGASPVAKVIAATVPSTAALTSIAVNPGNASQIVVNASVGDKDNDFYRSLDGGVTWAKSSHTLSNIFTADANRPGRVVWASGGSLYGFRNSHFIVKSTDSGTTLTTANKGFTGIAVDSGFQFNVQNPDILFLPAVDFNGAQTIDGGATWVRMIDMDRQNTGTSTWGWIRAGYSLTADIIYGAASESWSPYRQDFRRTTTRGQVTNGGSAGSQWTTIDWSVLNTANNNIHSSLGDPVFANACTYYNFLSVDQGQSWSAMTNVRGVFTYDRTVVMSGGSENKATSRQLIGVRSYTDAGGSARSAIVRATRNLDASGSLVSYTWNDVPGGSYGVSWFTDIAYDHVNNVYYVTDSSRTRLLKFTASTQTWTNLASNTPADQRGGRIFWSVAVDPVDPRIVYATGTQGGYCNTSSVVRSTDGGTNWTRLTANTEFGIDGARNGVWVRVHPGTREAWVATSCYGLWKIARPGAVTGGGSGGGSTTIFAETFDSQATGSAPSGFTASHSAHVTTVEFPSASDKSLRVYDPNNYTVVRATRDFGQNLSGVIQIELRFRLDSVVNWQRPLNLTDSAGTGALSLVISGGGLKSESSGGVMTNVVSTLSANTWYDLQVSVNTNTDTCDISVNGQTVLTNHPLRAAVSNLRSMDFSTGTSVSNANMWFDDILVSQ